jgi:O-antigen biosynthesis protein
MQPWRLLVYLLCTAVGFLMGLGLQAYNPPASERDQGCSERITSLLSQLDEFRQQLHQCMHSPTRNSAGGNELLVPQQTTCPPCPNPAHLKESQSQVLNVAEPSKSQRLSLSDAKEFAQLYALPNSKTTRVCLVTSAIAGPTKNGGIAAAFKALAHHMSQVNAQNRRNQFNVTVLYAAHAYYSQGRDRDWISSFAQQGINFVPLPGSDIDFYGHKYVVRAYRIFEWLRDHEHEFDVISYHDNMANGYYVALAKHQRLHFLNTFLFVQCHSTVRWADSLNYRPPKDHNTLGYYYMEQKSIEWADARVSPSEYYLKWMIDEGRYNLEGGLSFVVQNLMNPLPSLKETRRSITVLSGHFAFFARLEPRKGLIVFCDSLDILNKQSATSPVKRVTFLGPNVKIESYLASEYIHNRATTGQWKFTYELLHDLDTEQALDFIKVQNAVTVLPTLGDNSPYAVMELLSHNLPMITSDAGGGFELFNDNANIQQVVVPAGDALALADAMHRAATTGIPLLTFKSDPASTRDTYLNLIRAFHAKALVSRDANAPTLSTFQPYQRVVVGITTHDRPHQLFDCVQSITMQDYPSDMMHVVVIDDASSDPDVPQSLHKCKVVLTDREISHSVIGKDTHGFVAQRRNEIIDIANNKGADFVCFMVRVIKPLVLFSLAELLHSLSVLMALNCWSLIPLRCLIECFDHRQDDDDLALPQMLKTYMFVAHVTGASLVTDISDNYNLQNGVLRHSHRSLAIGNSFAHNFFINNFGKANFCVNPKLAKEFGGHQVGTLGNSPYVDWGFLFRASLHGLHMELVPHVLYKYAKYSKGSIFYEMTSLPNKYKGHMKMVNDSYALVPEGFRDVLLYCRFKLGVPQVEGDGPL